MRTSARKPHPAAFAVPFLFAVAFPQVAAAHIEITSHETRHGVDQQKVGPCGAAGAGPGDTVYTYAPGQTVELRWHEFIDHPGHYRVAFDVTGSDAFVDPATADDLFAGETVVLDGIADEPDVHDYAVQLELPEQECEACTIQIVQVMTDKPPFGDGNDLYYHCIDVRLVADAGETGETGDTDPSADTGETGDTDPSAEASEAGCACVTGPTRAPFGTGLGLGLISLLALRRRHP